MSYVPQNPLLYNAALAGFVSGSYQLIYQGNVGAVGFGEVLSNGQRFAEAVDLLIAPTTVTASMAQAMNGLCEATSSERYDPGANGYAASAAAVVRSYQSLASTLEPASGTTSATVVSGQGYDVLNTDSVVRMDTSSGSTAIAVLPVPLSIGETHSFVWIDWDGDQIPPQIRANAGAKLMPYTGMAKAGNAGLTAFSTITQVGGSYTLEWDGTEWVSL